MVELPKIERPVVKTERDGLATIERLSLASCGIGSNGLKALSATLKNNNDSLKTLVLRRNKFGVKHTEVAAPGTEEDDDEPEAVPVTQAPAQA